MVSVSISDLHCRNGTALREVSRTLKRALGNRPAVRGVPRMGQIVGRSLRGQNEGPKWPVSRIRIRVPTFMNRDKGGPGPGGGGPTWSMGDSGAGLHQLPLHRHSDSHRTVVDAQGDCEKEYERDYSWLHCRNGTALREVARTLKRALGNTSDPLYGA